MASLVVKKSKNLKGEIIIPPNKSHSFRSLIFALLANGESIIKNPALSGDWERGLKAVKMYGAKIKEIEKNIFKIKGVGGNLETPDEVIDAGNSGQIFRFFMGVAACCSGYTVITGDHSIRHIRLGGPLIQALNNLGAFAISTKNDGHAPVVIKGKIKGGFTEIDGFDSQPVSGLLIGCAMAKGKSEIKVLRAGEKPWVGLTLSWFDKVGIKYRNINNNFEHYIIPGKSKVKPFEVEIPRDWSAALYPIVAALITPGSDLTIKGLDPQDAQGDKKTVEVLQKMGANIKITQDFVRVKHSQLKGRKIDCNDFIDQFMILAVVGAFAQGKTTLYNAEMCRHKECDRIKNMYEGLKKMGAKVEEMQDGLVIHHSRLKEAQIDGKADHRMVMTFAAAGLQTSGETIISEAEYIEKSFPDFVQQMSNVGAKLKLLEK